MIALDPNVRVPFSLECDQDKPEAERPVFFSKPLTCRQWSEVRASVDAVDTTDTEKAVNELVEILRGLLVDWRNVPTAATPIGFDVEQLPDILTFGEMWEVLYSSLNASELSGADRKNSDSPSGSDTGSAAEAVQDVQNA